MTKRILGQSVKGHSLELVQLTKGPKPLLLIGGVHGDEGEGVYLVDKFMKSDLWRHLDGKASLYVIPQLNPDGVAANDRVNGHGVDLNRNMPTKDWSPVIAKPRYHPGPSAGSEPETVILMKLIDEVKPAFILSCHSWEPMINYNGPCRAIAEHMSHYNKYRVSDDIGYPTPGSLGTWAGWERQIPTITLEIRNGAGHDEIWSTHAEALQRSFEYAAQHERYE